MWVWEWRSGPLCLSAHAISSAQGVRSWPTHSLTRGSRSGASCWIFSLSRDGTSSRETSAICAPLRLSPHGPEPHQPLGWLQLPGLRPHSEAYEQDGSSTNPTHRGSSAHPRAWLRSAGKRMNERETRQSGGEEKQEEEQKKTQTRRKCRSDSTVLFTGFCATPRHDQQNKHERQIQKKSQ